MEFNISVLEPLPNRAFETFITTTPTQSLQIGQEVGEGLSHPKFHLPQQ